MIIYDWDDTLFCTTFLGQLGFVDIPPEILATLKPLDEAAVSVSLLFSSLHSPVLPLALLIKKFIIYPPFENILFKKFYRVKSC